MAGHVAPKYVARPVDGHAGRALYHAHSGGRHVLLLRARINNPFQNCKKRVREENVTESSSEQLR
jgi:hypothetical protein